MPEFIEGYTPYTQCIYCGEHVHHGKDVKTIEEWVKAYGLDFYVAVSIVRETCAPHIYYSCCKECFDELLEALRKDCNFDPWNPFDN